MKRFLRDHASKYEYISMDNGKYLVWKLSFPRIGDSFVTTDQLVDLVEWEQIYENMQRLTAQFETVQASSELIIERNRFKLQIERISDPLRVQCYRRFDVDHVDMNLLHTEAMLLTLTLNENYTDVLIQKLGDGTNSFNFAGKNSVGTVIDATTSSTNQSGRKRSSSTLERNDNNNKLKNPRRESPFESSLELILSSDFNDYSSETDSKSTIIGSSSDQEFVYNEDARCDEECEHGNISLSDDDVIPTNLEQLQNAMTKDENLKLYGFEDNVDGGYNFRLFDNIYTVENRLNYASFHSAKVISHIKGHSQCKLFIYYSDEILKLFLRMRMSFQGIAHVLVVFVNNVSDRITPFGVFLLPNKNEELLDDVIGVIDKWLNKENSDTTTIIATCTTPHDIALHRSVGKQWPNTKLIGCSLQYQNDVKRYWNENRGRPNSQKTQSTRLACLLCYLPKENISSGIDVIEQYSNTDYSDGLVRYLRQNWLNRSISVYGEAIHQRSITICTRFFKRIEKGYFRTGRDDDGNTFPQTHENIFEFIKFLRNLFHNEELCMDKLDSRNRMGYSTKSQKEKEDKIMGAMYKFELNQELVKPVKDYMFKLLNVLYK